jgi:hypothetical protein
MSRTADRPRSPHARYSLRFFDCMWNEMTELECPMLCASAMLERLEKWNRDCQREARIDGTTIPDAAVPAHASIEVHYV